MKRFVLLILAAVLTGCATYQPVPEGYTGPTATISDTAFRTSAWTAQVFAVTEIDGQLVHNSVIATRVASGYPLGMQTVSVDRKVLIRPMTLKLVATHVGNAPIIEVFGAVSGTYLHIEGVATFTPESGAEYYVRGGLLKEEQSVWLANAKTGERVTEKVVSK